jgi:hypothetical protein
MEADEVDEVRVIRLKLTGPSSFDYPYEAIRRGSLSLSNFLNKKRVKTSNTIDTRLKRRGP